LQVSSRLQNSSQVFQYSLAERHFPAIADYGFAYHKLEKNDYYLLFSSYDLSNEKGHRHQA